MGLPDAILPNGQHSKKLPPTVAGIDLSQQVELRQVVLTIHEGNIERYSLGDDVPFEVVETDDARKLSRTKLRYGLDLEYEFPLGKIGFLATNDRESELNGCTGAKVVSVFVEGELLGAQVQVSFLAHLQRDTLAYLLREMGYVREKDVRGSMEWYYRTLATD